MKKALFLSLMLLITVLTNTKSDSCTLTLKATGLKNSEGNIIFALYNKEGSLPDENFKNYYKKEIVSIVDEKAEFTFNNLAHGLYAVTILHDENDNEKIDKKFMLPLPKEGIGFSNFDDFGLNNRPNFRKTSFNLVKDTTIAVKIIYK